MSIIQFIEDLPEELVSDVKSLFNKADAAWTKLSPEVQAALKNGSGILAVINNDINGEYAPIVLVIEQKFGVTSEQVNSVLAGLAKAFNIAVQDTSSGTELLKAIQTYLSGLGTNWGAITSAAAVIGGEILNGGSPISIAVSVIQTIYETIVKPLLAK